MKIRLQMISLMVATLLTGLVVVTNANAELRVQATVHTPNVSVRVGNTTSSHHRSYKRRSLPRRTQYVYITKRDRKIAKRLARFTGIPAREFIHMRRLGYRWVKIGRWLDVPRPVVRAAMHKRSWKRFLREEQRLARCGRNPRGFRVVAHFGN